MKKITLIGWERISKANARKRFNAGELIGMLPCKVIHPEIEPIYSYEDCLTGSFDDRADAVTQKYCNDGMGAYLSFYRQV